MINDKKNKGMIFNFINIIDFLVIVFIITGVISIFIIRASKKAGSNENLVMENIKVTFFAEAVPETVPKFINIGDRVEDVKTKSFLGDIEEINISDGFVYYDDRLVFFIDDDKKSNKSYKGNYNSIELVTTVEASQGSTGMIINGTRYLVGHSLTFRAGDSNIYGKISGFDIIE